jgi:hypothetical protein
VKTTKNITPELIAHYRADIVARGAQLDPDNEEDWESMALGYAIGRGWSVEDALEFSRIAIKYQGSVS